MGRVSENGYTAIDKTSFGADTSDKLSFFTGKPYIDGLGYAFLLHNYRADMGKWISQDLIGYPDGWNNFAYCNNSVIFLLDHMGTIVFDLRSYGYPVADKSGSFVLVAHGSDNIGYPVDQRNIINSKVLSPQKSGEEDLADQLAKLSKGKVYASKNNVIIRNGESISISIFRGRR